MLRETDLRAAGLVVFAETCSRSVGLDPKPRFAARTLHGRGRLYRVDRRARGDGDGHGGMILLGRCICKRNAMWRPIGHIPGVVPRSCRFSGHCASESIAWPRSGALPIRPKIG